MFRALPMLVGLTVLVAVGLVHGLWTDRWQPSSELIDARERLGKLPENVGAWKSREAKQDPEALEMAGAVGHYSRSFLDPETGESVLVILLVGKANRMSVHRPDHCYTAAGYEIRGKPGSLQIQPKGQEPAEFATAMFSREEATGPSLLRIFWGFYASGRWSAPDSPRWQFAREKVLYKLYVLRSVAGQAGPIKDDPCVRLMGEFLPILDRTLAGS